MNKPEGFVNGKVWIIPVYVDLSNWNVIGKNKFYQLCLTAYAYFKVNVLKSSDIPVFIDAESVEDRQLCDKFLSEQGYDFACCRGEESPTEEYPTSNVEESEKQQ